MAVEKAKNVPPFVLWCSATIPTAFDDSMSYYEALCALYKFIQDNMVEPINHNADVLEQTVEDMKALKEYVDTYFENLDVQEEINNKLDAMAESGQLATIIDQFVNLGVIFTYDTVADMIAATNLASGCACKTLGKETLNDGYGAYYKIDTTGDILLDNGLYATLIDDFGGNNYYNEITISTGRDYDTDYYVATIPLNDADGNQIDPYVNDETDTHTRGTLQYAQDEFTTLSINAGLGRQDSHGTWIQGAVIANGVITRHDENDIPAPDYYSYMGIKADRSLVNFSGTTQPETMLAAGVVNAFLTFGQVVTNGVLTINEERISNSQDPLMYLGTKQDGTMIIVSFDGRTEHDYGINVTEGASKMLELGCTNAWNLDGGGSSSMVFKGSKQNRNIDEHGTKDRGIWVTLNFKKQTIDKELAKVNSFIGKERQLMNKQIRDDIYETYKRRKALLYMDSTSANTNNQITDADTPIILKFSRSYTYDNDNYIAIGGGSAFEPIKDENNFITGFHCNKPGLYKVSITADIYCANTNGYRSTFMTIENGVDPIGQSQVWDYINVSEANQTHLMSSTFVFNNAVYGNTFHVNGKGQVGDYFHRLYVTIEDIGTANGNR